MKKRIVSLLFTLVFLAVCLIPSAGLVLTGGAEAGANEVLAPLPRLRGADGSLNSAYLTQLANYVNDRFFLRQECVTAWSGLNAGLLGTSAVRDVILGSEGWLYYAPTLADYTRSEPMTERELWCAVRTLYLLQEYVHSRGGQFLFAVAPDKNSLYNENMPDYPRGSGESDARALHALLDEMDVAYADLFAVFEKQDETLYFPTDSHWNGRGAALAADAVLAALGRESGYFYGGFQPDRHRGDLYEMLYPAGTKTDLDWTYAPGYTFTAGSANPDSITLRTECAAASGSLLMFRDSFGRNLYPYMAESFAQAVFSRKNDYGPAAMADGGAVVIELVERNLRYLNLYPPTLPAPARDADPAARAVPSGAVDLAGKVGLDDYVNYTGSFDRICPDADSPVYILAGGTLFEAVPGPEGFSVWLSPEAAAEEIRVLFTSEGNLVSLLGVKSTDNPSTGGEP